MADMPAGSQVLTERLLIRPAQEPDRARMVSLWTDEDFMVFAPGPKSEEAAQRRFDHMLEVREDVPFAKQPVIERASGVIVGYTGVDWFDYQGRLRLEFGWRLAPEYRGLGYATEAAQALLDQARRTFVGEIFVIIDLENLASQNVCRKLGFTPLGQASLYGGMKNLYRMAFG
jgi:RimJ/RimL family protein N-acetyltransferase